MQLTQIVLAILNRVSQILTIVGLIQGNTSKAAQENVPFEIATNVSIIRSVVDWSELTPGALRLKLEALESQIDNLGADLTASIADLQLAAEPVVLPTTPPTGYGGGSGGSSAADIWNYQYPPGSGNIMGDKVRKAGRFAEFVAQDTWFPHAYFKYVGHHFDYSNATTDPSTYPPLVIDPSTILSTDDTIVDWLNRTVSGFTWSYLNGQVVSFDHTVISDEWWVCTITDLEFQQYKGAAPAVIANMPPIWPGIANVTFLDAYEIDRQMYVNIPHHGVLCTITAAPDRLPFYVFNTWKSYKFLGQISFWNDDGDSEPPQTLAHQFGVFVPKTMTIAEGFSAHTTGGVEGTITPWVITA